MLYLVILVAAATALVAVAVVRATHRLGLPALLVFLGIGLLLGEGGLGIEFDDMAAAQTLGTLALAIILIDGGLSTRFSTIRDQLRPASVLATVGVGVSVAVTTLATHFVLGFNWQIALLLGAVVASTDAAAIFSVLRGVSLPRKVSGVLEAESGLNDAPAFILVATFASTAATGQSDGWAVLGLIVWQLVIGAAIGFAVGFGGAALVRHLALPVAGLYPLTVFSLGLSAFALAGVSNASGILAAYIAALILGNSSLPHRAATASFGVGFGWVAQVGLFTMLGLLASPTSLPAAILPGIAVGLILTLLARPLSVFICLLPFRFSLPEQVLISWAGLRGAVPIVLATIPAAAHLSGAGYLWDIVFVLVVVFTLVQGPTLPWVAKRLTLSGKRHVRDLDMEAAPLDTIDGEVLSVAVPPGSQLSGMHLFELRLPEPTAVVGVVREGVLTRPNADFRIKVDDEMLVITPGRLRETVEDRLEALSQGGRLTRWHLGVEKSAPPARRRFWQRADRNGDQDTASNRNGV